MNFERYNHLGFHNPYYINEMGSIIIANDLAAILPLKRRKILDYAGLVQVLSAGYSFGDRTLIEGINKTPWMARPSADKKQWEYFNLPSHDEKIYSLDKIANQFYHLLKDELLSYVGGKRNIGILITGGMDSRVVACVLNNMVRSGEIENVDVLGITWGNQGSRDVVYAKQICEIFGWEWTHLVVDAQQMCENINITADMGCPFSPIHLHAMAKIASLKDLDCVLAGSFGDSVGRAEFSGVKVQNLKSILGKINNVSGFLRRDYSKWSHNQSANDIKIYHARYPQKESYMLLEQDQQLHYMRRMLNECMSVIDKDVPLYQMFSAPEVFGFMWSLNPSLRTDSIYKILLDKYGNELAAIPWARTGLPYMVTDGIADSYNKRHHRYGDMLRQELFVYLEKCILDSSLLETGLFNKSVVKNILKACSVIPIKNSYFYEEKLAYLASLAIFIDKYRIETILPKEKSSFVDGIKPTLRYLAKFAVG